MTFRPPAAAVAALVSLPILPAGAAADGRQGPPLRVAGGDLLGTTGTQENRLRRMDPRTLRPNGPTIKLAGTDPRYTAVWTRARGRRIVVAHTQTEGFPGTPRVRYSTYASGSLRRVGARTMTLPARPDVTVPLTDRRVVVVQGTSRFTDPVRRLAVVDPVGGRVVRSVDLPGRPVSVRRLDDRVGVVVRGADGLLRLLQYDAEGREVLTSPLPAPPVADSPDADAVLRAEAGRAVVLYDTSDGGQAVVLVDLGTGAVDARVIPADARIEAADVLRVTGTSVVLAGERARANVLVEVRADGVGAPAPLPRGRVTITPDRLLFDGFRLTVTRLDGREVWSARTKGFSLYQSVALIGSRVVHRDESGDPSTAIRSAATGKVLLRREGTLALLREPVGSAEERTLYAALPIDVF